MNNLKSTLAVFAMFLGMMGCAKKPPENAYMRGDGKLAVPFNSEPSEMTVTFPECAKVGFYRWQSQNATGCYKNGTPIPKDAFAVWGQADINVWDGVPHEKLKVDPVVKNAGKVSHKLGDPQSLAISKEPHFQCGYGNELHDCTDADVVPEPMDVPALAIPSAYECFGGSAGYVPCAGYTCADKSRILLTDEQGGHHCVKF